MKHKPFPTVYVRVSTDPAAGSGHLSRMLALRQGLKGPVNWFVDPGITSACKERFSKTDEVFEEWKAAIGRVSQRGNVFVKLGALPIRMPSYDGDRSLPPDSEEVAAAWRPWLETCIDAFGPARSMYESNFPVQKRWCSYQVCWNAFKRISAGASAAEKTDLFFGAAARAYRIENVL